mmetsp:Transcript_22482/g.64677  ORF Transcript_22482/g.64677 Transcript_22482/m.64677 type:complete len:202 (+) Transcript_22482:305-910(+)
MRVPRRLVLRQPELLYQLAMRPLAEARGLEPDGDQALQALVGVDRVRQLQPLVELGGVAVEVRLGPREEEDQGRLLLLLMPEVDAQGHAGRELILGQYLGQRLEILDISVATEGGLQGGDIVGDDDEAVGGARAQRLLRLLPRSLHLLDVRPDLAEAFPLAAQAVEADLRALASGPNSLNGSAEFPQVSLGEPGHLEVGGM